MITLYPIPDPRFVDDASEGSMALVQKVITTIRSLRTERNVPSSVRSRVILNVADDYKKTILEGYQRIIAEQGRCREVVVRRTGDSTPRSSVTGLAGDVEVVLFLEATADTGAERAKLEKDLAKLIADRDYLAKKLENAQYRERAPAAVLEKDRARLAELEAGIERLRSALNSLNKV
jgi:valyl-tRNA synthetase